MKKRVLSLILCICMLVLTVFMPTQPAHAFAAETAIIYGLINGLLSLGTGMATSSTYNMQVIDAIKNSGQDLVDNFLESNFMVAGAVITGASVINQINRNDDNTINVNKGLLQAVSNWLTGYSQTESFNYTDDNSYHYLSEYNWRSNTPIGITSQRIIECPQYGLSMLVHYEIYKIYAKNANTEGDYKPYYFYAMKKDEVTSGYSSSGTTLSDTMFNAPVMAITETQVSMPMSTNSVLYTNAFIAGKYSDKYDLSTYIRLKNKTSSPYEMAFYNYYLDTWYSYLNNNTVQSYPLRIMPYSSDAISVPVEYTDSGTVWNTWDNFESENEYNESDLVISVPIPDDEETDVYSALTALLNQTITGTDAISQALVNTLLGAITGTTTAVTAGTGEIVDAITAVTDASTVELDMDKMRIPALIITKFPFCIPFDLFNAFNTFSSSGSTAPVFDMPLSYNGVSTNIHVDFSQFQAWANIIRWGILITFNVGLILVTRRLIKG